MREAEKACAANGRKLTAMRRHVLETLAASHAALGAYEIIERIGAKRTPPAPITVYRALDFLVENGLAHRIESRNAYLACAHLHRHNDMVVFLICEQCRVVGEAPSAALAETLAIAAQKAGFALKTPVIEVSGLCAHCRKT